MSNENKIRILYVQPANIRRNGSLQMSCAPSAACRWVAGYISSVRNLQERTPILS